MSYPTHGLMSKPRHAYINRAPPPLKSPSNFLTHTNQNTHKYHYLSKSNSSHWPMSYTRNVIERRASQCLMQSVALSRAQEIRESEERLHELEAQLLSSALPEGFNYESRRSSEIREEEERRRSFLEGEHDHVRNDRRERGNAGAQNDRKFSDKVKSAFARMFHSRNR